MCVFDKVPSIYVYLSLGSIVYFEMFASPQSDQRWAQMCVSKFTINDGHWWLQQQVGLPHTLASCFVGCVFGCLYIILVPKSHM
jgi:hypothetical protein